MSWSWRMRNLPLSHNRIPGIVLHPGHEIGLLAGPSTEQGVVVIRPIIDHDGSGSEGESRSHLHLRHLSLGDHGKLGKVSIMFQQ